MSFKLRKPNPKGETRISLHSIEGYKADSPDKDNDINVIHSSTITMEGVPHDVIGTDNLGNTKLMPEGSGIHTFLGDKVTETPLKRDFKSSGNYKKWLAYGHASGEFAKKPGHQKVSIKGKSKKVKH